ncbi:hypothetical protein T492DRAFT_164738 [Pavlovales sp. CCMP2436]|nr:hypothetical protein T492DRAFT_164738 [Pavlovales sp. CCMP2436]|mmetsp:Transcript_45963/g.105992  ORF Transcript_45963/g.105992 Transcript_45963/m.105992 type:complete len:87 (-) Transcript_45963:70-330(-)
MKGKLIYLAPYSPIDNPIEFGFSVFKSCFQRKYAKLDAISDHRQAIAACMAMCYEKGQPRRDVQVANALATFASCGYAAADLMPSV